MPFGLCNAPATFQRCMLAIFHDMIEESVKVFMDDFFVFGNSFDKCLNNLDKMLQRCKDAHLDLNWEKCHFMVKEGIVFGHKASGAGLEVNKSKIDIISKLPTLPISKQSTNAFVKDTFMDLKTQLEVVAKIHQDSIQNLETKFNRLADKQSGRPFGSLPSNTQPNPQGNNSKAYQPQQSRNEQVNAVFTRSGKSYDPPVNLNDQQNETPISFDSDNEDEDPTPQPKTQPSKPIKETPIPKPYKPKIPYP
nr:retrovirus-related Pol polyprotein from transposon 17.6 [Tanacetum cinerariifolium]